MKLPLTALLVILFYSMSNAMDVVVAPEHALLEASKSGDIQLILKLLDPKIDLNLNAGDWHGGYTALMIAVARGYTEIVKILIAAGAYLDPLMYNYPQWAALVEVKRQISQLFDCSKTPFTRLPDSNYAINHSWEIAQLRALNNLVKTHKLRLDFIDPNGNTLLHNAILSGNRVMIGLLIHLIIKHNQHDALGYKNRAEKQTAVELAVTKGGAWLLKPFFKVIADHKPTN